MGKGYMAEECAATHEKATVAVLMGSGRVGTVAAVRAGEGKRMGVGRGLRRATVETGSTIAL
jgi:hypothetical protein